MKIVHNVHSYVENSFVMNYKFCLKLANFSEKSLNTWDVKTSSHKVQLAAVAKPNDDNKGLNFRPKDLKVLINLYSLQCSSQLS